MNTQRAPWLGLVGSGQGGAWGHVLVSVSACVLTVSIAGSAVTLAYKGYERYDLRKRVRTFVASLENRSPEELQEWATQLRGRRKLAEHVVPELWRALRSAPPETELCAAIEMSRAFLGHRRIRDALFDLRRDGRETVAASAVRALAEIEPAQAACDRLGRCLEGANAGELCEAALDEACAGLVRLAEPGLAEMKRRVAGLSPERRIWLAGYAAESAGPNRAAWLEMLKSDADGKVRAAADRAMGRVVR